MNLSFDLSQSVARNLQISIFSPKTVGGIFSNGLTPFDTKSIKRSSIAPKIYFHQLFVQDLSATNYLRLLYLPIVM